MSPRLINRGNFEKIFTSGHPGIVSHLGVQSVTVSDGSLELAHLHSLNAGGEAVRWTSAVTQRLVHKVLQYRSNAYESPMKAWFKVN